MYPYQSADQSWWLTSMVEQGRVGHWDGILDTQTVRHAIEVRSVMNPCDPGTGTTNCILILSATYVEWKNMFVVHSSWSGHRFRYENWHHNHSGWLYNGAIPRHYGPYTIHFFRTESQPVAGAYPAPSQNIWLTFCQIGYFYCLHLASAVANFWNRWACFPPTPSIQHSEARTHQCLPPGDIVFSRIR